MAFTLVVKNSSTAGKAPTVANIEKGELAINLADQRLYSRSATDEIFEIGRSGETPSGGTDQRPDAPSIGDLFYDEDLKALLYWDGGNWVPVGTEAIAIGDLTDVDDTGVANGMVLSYDNGTWKPVSAASLAVDVDLGYTANGNNAGTVTNTAGDDATIPVATNSVAGLFTGTEKQKLAGIEAGATNQDLSYRSNGQSAGTVEITDGTDAVIPIATSGQAGLFTGTEKDKLAGIEAGAETNLWVENSGKLYPRTIGNKVSIGTTSAVRALHVYDGTGFNQLNESGGTFSYATFQDTNSTSNVSVRVGSSGDDAVIFAGGNERVRVDASGSVGIGSDSPETKLDVAGGGKFRRDANNEQAIDVVCEAGGNFVRASSSDSAKKDLIIENTNATQDVFVKTGGSNRVQVSGSGGVYLLNLKNAEKLSTDSSGQIIAGTSGGGTADEAVKLKNSRNLWGQPFNGTADVKGAIVGATNITGTNANMTVRPNAGGNKALYLKGGESNDGSTSGAVYMGESKGGNLHFQHGSGGKFRFYKSGGGNYGILDFDNCTGTRTYSYPNWSGNVVITTTGSANAETRFSKIITDNNNWFKKGWLCASTSNYSPYNATSGNGVATDNNTFNCNRTTSGQHEPTMWVNRCGASLKGAWIRFQFDGTDPDQTEIKQNGQGKVNFRGLNTSYRTDMDARKVGDSLTDIINATAVIKALEPKREGFIAQKVGRLIAHAVDSLNENQTIELGTHTKSDGVEFTRVEQPEAIPYGETWVKTEDYDLPVGLDQAALIPFLTKALQEALERIEALEAKLAST